MPLPLCYVRPVGCISNLWVSLPRAGKWARGPWSGSDEDETRVKEETQATLRCFPFDQPQPSGEMTCFLTGKPAKEVAVFAKAY